ncbi:hypothetical protein [Silanimonas sp.]|uniref:hypothetical protein n=1 Tax=Silanimonas sp. TaxID=1929290 RepID=UPI001BB9BCCB|nr:hypothetical protein [Silanimonas sp.]MBS3895921.1 hypothetical protein [Silanimonas sp.]
MFDRATVLAMLKHFDREVGDWTQRLLQRTPVTWSEFATYASFARRHGDRSRLSFQENPHVRRIGNVEQRRNAETLIQDAFADRNIWFLTIESDRRLAARWSIQQHLSRLEGLLA